MASFLYFSCCVGTLNITSYNLFFKIAKDSRRIVSYLEEKNLRPKVTIVCTTNLRNSNNIMEFKNLAVSPVLISCTTKYIEPIKICPIKPLIVSVHVSV